MLKNIFLDVQVGSFSSSMEVHFDGRLHERSKLCSDLELLESRSDAEIVLYAYQKWGKSFSEKIQGDYALVIWDPAQQTLLAVRDRLGIRPLYYIRLSEGRILISSELTVLARHPLVSRKPNEVALACYFLDDWSDQASTFYQGIYRLPPAHYLLLNSHTFQVQAYWQFQPSPLIRLGSDAEYAECYGEIFKTAIRDRLPKDGNVGVLLSGGLDSSSIACQTESLIRQERRSVQLSSYSLRFSDPAADDHNTIQNLQNEKSWKFRILEPNVESLRFVGSKTEEGSEDLNYDLVFLLFKFIFESARQDGVHQFFTGYGADEVLTPSEMYYADLLRSGRWGDLWREIRINQYRGSAVLGALLRFAVKPLVPRSLVQILRRTLIPRKAPHWMSNEFVNRHHLLDSMADRYQLKVKLETFSQASRYFRLFVWGGYSRGWEQLDQVARRNQTEFSQPFFDLRLIHYAFQLPQEQLAWNGRNKQLLRNAMAGVVPDPVRLQPKFQDYMFILEGCLRRERFIFEKWLQKPLLAETGLFSPQQLRDLWESSLKNGEIAVALRICNMERWLRTF